MWKGLCTKRHHRDWRLGHKMYMVTRVGYDVCDGPEFVRHMVVCGGGGATRFWSVIVICNSRCDNQLTGLGCASVGLKTWNKVPQDPVRHRAHLHCVLVIGYVDWRLRSKKNVWEGP
jgi:hypothetical protein